MKASYRASSSTPQLLHLHPLMCCTPTCCACTPGKTLASHHPRRHHVSPSSSNVRRATYRVAIQQRPIQILRPQTDVHALGKHISRLTESGKGVHDFGHLERAEQRKPGVVARKNPPVCGRMEQNNQRHTPCIRAGCWPVPGMRAAGMPTCFPTKQRNYDAHFESHPSLMISTRCGLARVGRGAWQF